MVFLFFIIGLVGALLAWKKVSKSNIERGHNKFISHLAGSMIGIFIWFFILAIGIAIFEPKPNISTQDTTIKTPQLTSTEPSYIADKKLTAASIKSISPQIESANIYEQYAGENKGLNNIDVHINTKMFWGGAQDWNGVALTIFDLSKSLFKRSDIGKISFVVWNDDHTLDWARIEVDRKKLPQKWEELTYLEFFSHTKPMSGSVDAEEWLTEFYSKYNSAHPSNN